MQVLFDVVLGGGVAAAFLGHHVNDDGAPGVGGRIAKCRLHGSDVVAVERSEVTHAERLEERRRLPHLAHGRRRAVQSPPHAVAERHALEQVIHDPPPLHIVRRLAQP